MVCQLCLSEESEYRYGGLDICRNDYNLIRRTAEKMRTVIGGEYVIEAEPKDVIQEVVKRRAELKSTGKWEGNRKRKVESPSITVFGSRHSDEGEENNG